MCVRKLELSIVDVLQICLADYRYAITLKSQIAMDLHLGSRHMCHGLCNYFKRRFAATSDEIIRELEKDVPASGLHGMPFVTAMDCTSMYELIEMALRPRYELLQRTVARLQNEIQTTTP